MAQASKLSFPIVFHTENCAIHPGNPTANDSLVFIHHSHTYKKTHRTDKKNWQTWWEICVVPENIQFFVQFFFTLLNCTVFITGVWGHLVSISRKLHRYDLWTYCCNVARRTGQNSCPADAEDALRNHTGASVKGVVFVLKNCETLWRMGRPTFVILAK